MESCIVGLCHGATEGVLFYEAVSQYNLGVPIFCIFYGMEDLEAAKSLPAANRLFLPKQTDEEAALRAAMIWVPRIDVSLENLIFCYSEEIPDSAELEFVLTGVMQRGKCSGLNCCWGLSLVSAMLHGWSKEFRSLYRPLTTQEHLVQMGQAMRGEAVTAKVLLDATREVLPSRITRVGDNGTQIAPLQFAQHLERRTNPSGLERGLVATRSGIGKDFLTIQIASLGPGEMLAVVGLHDVENALTEYAPLTPHRILQGRGGLYVLIFGPRSKMPAPIQNTELTLGEQSLFGGPYD